MFFTERDPIYWMRKIFGDRKQETNGNERNKISIKILAQTLTIKILNIHGRFSHACIF